MIRIGPIGGSSLTCRPHSERSVQPGASADAHSRKMTRDALTKCVGGLADRVLADQRCATQRDDLGVSILGMLLYGFALATGRTVMFLDIEDIDAAVQRVMIEHVGAAAKWTTGLVADAHRSSFDKAHHVGQFELIGVGHSYFGEQDEVAIVDNVFANIQNFRRRAQSAWADAATHAHSRRASCSGPHESRRLRA